MKKLFLLILCLYVEPSFSGWFSFDYEDCLSEAVEDSDNKYELRLLVNSCGRKRDAELKKQERALTVDELQLISLDTNCTIYKLSEKASVNTNDSNNFWTDDIDFIMGQPMFNATIYNGTNLVITEMTFKMDTTPQTDRLHVKKINIKPLKMVKDVTFPEVPGYYCKPLINGAKGFKPKT